MPIRLPVLSRLAAAGALVASILLGPPAHGDDRAAAQALFDAAKALALESKFAEACPKFEASYKLDRALGTLLNMADCHEKIGKVASAWAEFEEAADRAARAADNRVDYAKQRRDALTPRLPKLQITIGKPVRTLAVVRDEVKVDEAMYGVALPVDPGSHAVVVKRGEQVLKEEKVEAAEGGTATVTLDLEAIDKANPPPVPTATATATGPQPPPPPSSQKAIGFIVGGVGAAAVIGAVVLEIVAINKKPGASDCVNKFCTPTGIDAANSAKTFADVGQWVGIGGLAAAAIGVTLILTAPSAPAEQPRAGSGRRRAALAPWIAPGGGGVALGGRL